MNDFAKNELERIYEGLDDYWCSLVDNKDLIGKIKSLIDNYCEHDMDYAAGEHSSCRKCGARE